MSKVKAKHEKELIELNSEIQRDANKLAQYEERYKQSTQQLFSMNEKYLILLKENEIMKSKLRNYENNVGFSSGRTSNVPPKFIENIRGK